MPIPYKSGSPRRWHGLTDCTTGSPPLENCVPEDDWEFPIVRNIQLLGVLAFARCSWSSTFRLEIIVLKYWKWIEKGTVRELHKETMEGNGFEQTALWHIKASFHTKLRTPIDRVSFLCLIWAPTIECHWNRKRHSRSLLFLYINVCIRKRWSGVQREKLSWMWILNLGGARETGWSWIIPIWWLCCFSWRWVWGTGTTLWYVMHWHSQGLQAPPISCLMPSIGGF